MGMMLKFKIGDRVICPNGSYTKYELKNKKGTILDNDSTPYVEFDDDINGHSGGGLGKASHCWAIDQNHLELLTGEEK